MPAPVPLPVVVVELEPAPLIPDESLPLGNEPRDDVEFVVVVSLADPLFRPLFELLSIPVLELFEALLPCGFTSQPIANRQSTVKSTATRFIMKHLWSLKSLVHETVNRRRANVETVSKANADTSQSGSRVVEWCVCAQQASMNCVVRLNDLDHKGVII